MRGPADEHITRATSRRDLHLDNVWRGHYVGIPVFSSLARNISNGAYARDWRSAGLVTPRS